MAAKHVETWGVMDTTPARGDLVWESALYPDLFGDAGADSYASTFRLKA